MTDLQEYRKGGALVVFVRYNCNGVVSGPFEMEGTENRMIQTKGGDREIHSKS